MKKDCFAYNPYKRNHCNILNVKGCTGNCAFYKTREQADLDKLKAIERIYDLDFHEQEVIDMYYYKGKLFQEYRELIRKVKLRKTS